MFGLTTIYYYIYYYTVLLHFTVLCYIRAFYRVHIFLGYIGYFYLLNFILQAHNSHPPLL